MFKDTTSLLGHHHDRLTIVGFDGSDKHGLRVEILCECGVTKIVSYCNYLRMKSCGCWRKEQSTRHGHTTRTTMSPTYQTWRGMIQRCLNPNAQGYEYYGGRGITIISTWVGPGGFKQFLADMGERPEGRSLDRKDNDGNYEPANCHWATWSEQMVNRRFKER